MPKKFHIGKSGKPTVCEAKDKPCPLGSDSPHFNNPEEAYAYIEERNEADYAAPEESISLFSTYSPRDHQMMRDTVLANSDPDNADANAEAFDKWVADGQVESLHQLKRFIDYPTDSQRHMTLHPNGDFELKVAPGESNLTELVVRRSSGVTAIESNGKLDATKEKFDRLADEVGIAYAKEIVGFTERFSGVDSIQLAQWGEPDPSYVSPNAGFSSRFLVSPNGTLFYAPNFYDIADSPSGAPQQDDRYQALVPVIDNADDTIFHAHEDVWEAVDAPGLAYDASEEDYLKTLNSFERTRLAVFEKAFAKEALRMNLDGIMKSALKESGTTDWDWARARTSRTPGWFPSEG